MITELRSAYADGSLSPVSDLETRLVVAKDVASQIGTVFSAHFPARARQEAAASADRYSARRPLSALDGMSIAWKDIFAIQGHVNRAGLLHAIGRAAAFDAELVSKASELGMITLGATTMSEAGYSLLGENDSLGWPRNPCGGNGAPFLTGGSSSGSALAVASNCVTVAIGTDSGGSSRLPAGWCGVTGLKPTAGTLSAFGCLPFSPSVDSVCILTRSAQDASIAFAGLSGQASDDWVAGNGNALRFVVPVTQDWAGPSVEVERAFNTAIEGLREKGLRVCCRHLPVLDAVIEHRRRHGSIACHEGSAIWIERLNELSPRIREQLHRDAEAARAGNLLLLHQARAELIATFIAELKEEFVVLPTSPICAPAHDAIRERTDYDAVYRLAGVYLWPFNVLDAPAISINGIRSETGLPVGIQLVAARGRDRELLDAALRVEAHLESARHSDRLAFKENNS